jgi:hypothetical protein
MNHEEARPGSNLDSNSQIRGRDTDTVYTRLGMWVHDREYACYQNAHLILLGKYDELRLKQGSYHPEKHWQRFSNEVACRISLST